MDHSALRRLSRGVIANSYGQLVTIAVQLIGVPILIHAWGVHQYGEWLLLFAVPAVLSVSDLGFAQSASNDMTARVARGDREGALRVFQSLLIFIAAVCSASLLLVTLAISATDVSALLRMTTVSSADAQIILWLFAAATVCRIPNAITHAGYRCNGENATHVGVDASTRLLQHGVVWLVALLGGSQVASAAAYAAIPLIATPVAGAFMLRRHRWLRLGAEHASSAQLRALIRPAVANAAIPVSQAIGIQGVSIVVGTIAGPASLVIFNTTRTLTRLVTQVVLVVNDAAEPELAVAHGRGDMPLLRDLFAKAQVTSFWLALCASIGSMLVGGSIINYWTGGAISGDPVLLALLTLASLVAVLSYSSLVLLKSANAHERAAMAVLGAAVGSVAVAIVLLEASANPSGAALAILLCEAVAATFIVKSARPFAGKNPLAMILGSLRASIDGKRA